MLIISIGLFGLPKINDFEHFLPKIFDQLKKLRREYFSGISPQLLTFNHKNKPCKMLIFQHLQGFQFGWAGRNSTFSMVLHDFTHIFYTIFSLLLYNTLI